ncbi:MAG: 30S ribosomal protein S9 [Desulfobaccales bacterium]
MTASANNIQATGKRKSAIARIYLRPGTGRIVVNQRAFEDYFPMETTRNLVRQPLNVVNAGAELDILINVMGGGLEGQAGAIRHGLSRALVTLNAEFRGALKKAGFLTRDPRIKERKKYGRRGARRGCQYSKR